MTRLTPIRLTPIRLTPIRLTLRSAWYLFAYQFIGWLLMSVVLTAVGVAATLAVTLAGIPLLVATAAVVRGCADLERARLRPMTGSPVQVRYRAPDRPGLLARAITPWKDVAIWREVAYLVGLFPLLATAGLVVLTLWLCCVIGVTMPLWYHFPFNHFVLNGHSLNQHSVSVRGVQLGYFPNGPHGAGAVGWYVQTLPQALLVAGLALVGLLLSSYLVIVTARAHAAVAKVLLRAPRDPLAQVKEVLNTPISLMSHN
jgi:hypothetical protein